MKRPTSIKVICLLGILGALANILISFSRNVLKLLFLQQDFFVLSKLIALASSSLRATLRQQLVVMIAVSGFIGHSHPGPA